MAFAVPNEASAFNADQAELDSVDIGILIAGLEGTTVLSGCAVSQRAAGANMSIDIASGVIIIANVQVTVASGNVAVTASDATNPRFDLVVVNNAGTKSVTAGTPAANAVFPAIPANSIVLAAVYVPANETTIPDNHITDKRVMTADAYALLTGRPGGQSLSGGTLTAQNLVLRGNAADTTGLVQFASDIDINSGKVIRYIGTTLLTPGAATPHLILAGEMQMNKLGINVAPNAARLLYASDVASTITAGLVGGEFTLAVTATGTSAQVVALFGGGTINGLVGSTLTSITYGLDFAAAGSSGTSPAGNTTHTGITGLRVIAGSRTVLGGANVNLVTTVIAGQLQVRTQRSTSGTSGITTGVGLDILTPVHQGSTNQYITNYYGIRVADYLTFAGTTPTINRLLEIGSSTPTTTSGLLRFMGNFAAAANQTPLYISEGATPTLRQLKTFDPGLAGVNFTAGQLVCVLV